MSDEEYDCNKLNYIREQIEQMSKFNQIEVEEKGIKWLKKEHNEI